MSSENLRFPFCRVSSFPVFQSNPGIWCRSIDGLVVAGKGPLNEGPHSAIVCMFAIAPSAMDPERYGDGGYAGEMQERSVHVIGHCSSLT